jgi:hypothetical protein
LILMDINVCMMLCLPTAAYNRRCLLLTAINQPK